MKRSALWLLPIGAAALGVILAILASSQPVLAGAGSVELVHPPGSTLSRASPKGNEGIAAQIVIMELFELGLDYLRRFPSIIESITADDIRTVAERVMVPETHVLSVAGPAS